MNFTVKKKIWLGTLFLFLLILITGGVSIYYTAKLKNDAKNVLQDNYVSLSYCQNMYRQLNNSETNYAESFKIFETNLQQQENNVTEPGEKKATTYLRLYFNRFKSGDTSKQNLKQIREQLQSIVSLNMISIKRKKHGSATICNRCFSYNNCPWRFYFSYCIYIHYKLSIGCYQTNYSINRRH